MTHAIEMAEIAALVGDPTRANMLAALVDGRAWTAGELAYAGHVTAQTASGHLARLAAAKLIVGERQGRHHYYRLASPAVAQMLEAIMCVASESIRRYRPSSCRDEAVRFARTCYDHLAGTLGVALADSLQAQGQVVFGPDGGIVTEAGMAFFEALDLDLAMARGRRVFCRPCLDWSERRPHLAGGVGAALASRLFALGWIQRVRDSRAVRITPQGEAGLSERFGVSFARDVETRIAARG